MRVVFMGTPAFAVPSLRALADSHDVVAVFSRPDARSGRGSALRPSPIKTVATELGIPVLQPHTLREPLARSQVAELEPDVICVAAYGLILPCEILELPPLGALNVHASLLPRWRGAAPIQRAILAGDTYTGVSIMRMEEGLDTGPYCEVRRVEVGDRTAEELTPVLAELGAEALLSALDGLAAGTLAWICQDDGQATYAPKLTKADIAVTPRLTAPEALRRIRASSPQAPVRVRIGATPLTILRARLVSRPSPAPGTVDLVPEGVVLGTSAATRAGDTGAGDAGALLVTTLKPDGKRGMSAWDWIRGARVSPGESWSSAE